MLTVFYVSAFFLASVITLAPPKLANIRDVHKNSTSSAILTWKD